jgi:thiamine pyrophosphokinase
MNQKIIFCKSDFDALLVLNGEISHLDYIKENSSKIYAADGAANVLLNNHVTPDFIIGDLDSLNKNKLVEKTKNICLVEDKNQDLNDFEKALRFIKSQNKSNILIFGFQGGELEHTLNNWSVLKKYINEFNLTILHNNRYAMPINNSIEIDLKENELISIIPQPTCILKTDGLKWNLDRERLELGFREGARNLTTGTRIKIELIEGEYLLFIDSRY